MSLDNPQLHPPPGFRKNVLPFLTILTILRVSPRVSPACPLRTSQDPMKMHYFVSGSGVMIVAWLLLTFIHEVSPQQYPQQRRRSLPAHSASGGATKPESFPQVIMAGNAAKFTVSLER